MADFKDEISPELIGALADELVRAWPEFPAAAFTGEAGDGLERLELMARVRRVAAVLGRHLPTDFAAAAVVLDAALTSPGFTSWMTLPCGFFATEYGIGQPELALPLLARLSPRFSSEGPVRPFIERYPDLTMGFVREWARDADDHVRRLASETTRPRLPWATRLDRFVRDPSPVIELLDVLRDDPSEYVRRSVANNLNDISKDHPELAVATARGWLNAGGEHVQEVVRHGLRTLVKKGDPDALALLGYDRWAPVRLEELVVEPARVPIGGQVELSFSLVAEGGPTPVVVDYLVYHAGARGARGAKVFKLTTRTLEPGKPQRIRRRHVFREVTVRRLYAGTQRLEVQVNGRVLGGADVELVEP
jgi:3-methyladenine DNA glycosylase AlkC